MDKPYASYFVSILGDSKTLPLAEKYLLETGIVPDYISGPEVYNGGLLYSVPEGSMPRWGDVDEVFTRMAERFPTLSIAVNENCEEPNFPNRTIIFDGGKLTEERWGRILEPDEYDKTTIDTLVEALRAAGMDSAADYIVGMELA